MSRPFHKKACDFCQDPVAPFGFAPPPRLGIQIKRPIWTCGAAECNAQAEARRQALIDNHDPLAGSRIRRRKSPDPAQDPAQQSLF